MIEQNCIVVFALLFNIEMRHTLVNRRIKSERQRKKKEIELLLNRVAMR